MVYSRNYARMFVTLKQESSDYSSDFREAMGRCVIEVRFGKGRFSAYIQGLKRGSYSLLFISCKNGNNIGVDIGEIRADSTGKGEFKIEFDPENVFGTNLKIEDFHVVAVIPFLSRTNKALLTGYVSGIVQWKEGFTFFDNENTNENNNKSSDNQLSEIIQPLEKSIPEENALEENTLEEDTSQEDISQENTLEEHILQENTLEENTSQENILEEHISEINEDNAAITETTDNEIPEILVNPQSLSKSLKDIDKVGQGFNDIIKKFKQGIEKMEEQEKRQKKQAEKFIKKSPESNNKNYGINYIFENNARMAPFQRQKKDILWVRIDLSELIVLPGRMWLYLNNPFVSFSEKKYKHLILGKFIENGAENYILGIPGRYFSDYRLEAGLQGFRQFKCCESKIPSDGDYGYWLLDIPKIM